MASLVADYVSDSDVDNELDENNGSNERDEPLTAKNEGNLFFSTAVSSSSSDEETEKDKTIKSEMKDKLPNPLAAGKMRLPGPEFLSSSTVKHSVFINPFKKAEEAKLSVLEQHVKLTDSERVKRENRKNICNNYKKGRCRFGSKCKYRHVSDLVTTDKSETVTTSETTKAHLEHGCYGHHSYHGNTPENEAEDDSYMGQMKRKHRAGIRDNLIPPKKAMRSLEDQRAKERPWTLDT